MLPPTGTPELVLPCKLGKVNHYEVFPGQHVTVRFAGTTWTITAIPRAGDAPPEKAKIPPGVHLAQGKRIGDAQKNKVLDRLAGLHATGYLGQDELHARMEAALAAQVQPELDLLVCDLPEILDSRPEGGEECRGRFPALSLVMFFACLTGMVSAGRHHLSAGVPDLLMAAFWGGCLLWWAWGKNPENPCR